jgi:FKBP-type peptidyl-prolyl cis-trans isomerase FklB
MKKQMLSTAILVLPLMTTLAATDGDDLKTKIDSVSYAMGAAQSNGLRNYAVQQLGVDSAYFADFVRGIREGVSATKTPKEKAYAAGQQIAGDVLEKILPNVNTQIFKAPDETHTLNKALLIEGFITAVESDSLRIPGGIPALAQYLDVNVPLIQASYMEEKYGQNKLDGEKFLAANKKKKGIQTTASGLQYQILTAGTGEKPKETDKVKVHYRGTLIDGTEFDSSYKRDEPTSFAANRVIKGWTEALTLMPVGSKWTLYIPQELAYGDRETGTIPPFSTLIFEVELLEIESTPPPATSGGIELLN